MKKYELTVLAMFSLGGSNKALDIEDIAVEADRLSPGAFAWRKYPNHINLELVGFAVRDAKKEKYGGYVSGSHAKGWRLTSAGVTLGQKLKDEFNLVGKVNLSPTRDNSLERKRANKELERIESSEAFISWKAHGDCTKKEIAKVLKINAYSSDGLLEVKFSRLSSLKGENEEIDQFIEFLITKKEDLI